MDLCAPGKLPMASRALLGIFLNIIEILVPTNGYGSRQASNLSRTARTSRRCLMPRYGPKNDAVTLNGIMHWSISARD